MKMDHDRGLPITPAMPRGRAFGSSCGARRTTTRSSPIRRRWPRGTTAGRPVPDWRERLVCSKCASREINMAATAPARRSSTDGSAARVSPRAAVNLTFRPRAHDARIFGVFAKADFLGFGLGGFGRRFSSGLFDLSGGLRSSAGTRLNTPARRFSRGSRAGNNTQIPSFGGRLSTLCGHLEAQAG